MSCNSNKNEKSPKLNLENLDLQGHRGCRGLYPENTIDGFIKALDLGVNTLEMDVVITKDSLVLVSHEPWFSHEIAIAPDSTPIRLDNEKDHKIFEMTYEETKGYDVGLREHRRFPEQKKIAAQKPLLRDVIQAAENHAASRKRPLPYYNIETKSTPDGDNIFHPTPEIFSDLLIKVLKEENVLDRSYVQSFDPRTLQHIHKNYPEVKLVLLVENSDGIETNLSKLGFTPEVYSPDFNLVNEDLVSFCRKKEMKLIPWTVNEKRDMEDLIEMGVDGLITDYPDRFNELKEKQ
jgi:glycerophosphoryl diester phosphodiesterase